MGLPAADRLRHARQPAATGAAAGGRHRTLARAGAPADARPALAPQVPPASRAPSRCSMPACRTSATPARGGRRQQRPARYADPHADRHPLIGTRQARAGRYLDSIVFGGVFGGQGSMPERRRAPNLAVSSFVALLEFGYPVASGWQLEALACGPAGHACRRRDARQPPRIPRRRAVAAAAGMPLAPSGRRPSPGAPRTRNSNHP